MMLCKANLPNQQARQYRLQGVQNLMIVLHPSQAASKARLVPGGHIVHQKIDEDQTAYTIWGCSTVILLYYLDWLDHPAGPEDRFRTPRISMFTSDMVTNLSRADVVHEGKAIACYGTLNFRPPAQTCYMAAPDLGSIYVPKLSKLLAGKIAALRGRTRRQFEEVCTVYDQDVDRQCQTIQSALNNIVEKQHNMVTTFGYLIDEVLHADRGEEDDDNEAAHGLSAQADHGHHGLQTDLNQVSSPNASENGIVIEALDIVAPPEFSQAQSSSAPHHETINKEPEDHEQQTVVGNLGQGQCTDHRHPTSHTHTAQMHDDQGEEGTQADMSQLSSTQLSTLANASLFSDSQIENMNDQLFEQQEVRKQKLTNDMGDDQDNQDGSPSRFLNLSNDESADVRKNLAHHGDEADGEDNGRLFNVNPRVTEALNDVTHIFSGLADINDVSQNGPPHFDYTPQQQGPSFDHTPASKADSVPQKPDVIPLQCLNTQRIIENCYERSAALLNLLTSTDLTFKDSVICRFGDDNSRAGEVRAYFAPRKEVADFWIQYYVHCLMKDEPKNRLLRKEYERIYLDFNVMRDIYQEGNAYGDEVVEYRQATLISTLDRFLLDQHLLKGVREIVVPFLRNRHFSVYVVNFKHHRVDILDPNPWNLIGDGWKETHKGTVKYGNSKGQWCKIMMKRLNEAIQAARPDSGIPKFGNYKCEMLDGIHKQKIGSNDYGFYCMWYMEYYDASTTKVLWPYSASSEQIWADVLQYIIFHEANDQKELPEEIEQLRPPY